MILHQTEACLAGCCAIVLQLVWPVCGEIEEVFQDEFSMRSLELRLLQ